ncbi:MAG: glycerol-3-phosphate dehydrogenase, partial [Gammaproteobacteria bacterium]|nr:glycerol-3-phosphate dehydrogenase [Gammaproteobacteria bacterium]
MEYTDLIVIGAGIHGVGVAANAASRGLHVTVFEKDDIGSGTSNASTKLIHGGLRYLETFQYKLVQECLEQQSQLLSLAGHLVRPMEFIIPLEPSLRPQWMVQLGLLGYDVLRKSALPWSQLLTTNERENLGLFQTPSGAFRYWDCQTDDHRLCIMEAMLAKQLGAKFYRNSPVYNIQSTEGGWIVQAKTPYGSHTVCGKAIAMMTGPGIYHTLTKFGLNFDIPNISLIQGSHIILPKCYQGNHALATQQPDGRLVFFVPYQEKWMLVGSTDHVLEGSTPPPVVRISEQERDYLLQAAQMSFGSERIKDSDIVHEYAGIRCLLGDREPGAKTSRESQIIEYTCKQYHHSCVGLIGGKLTSWRATCEKIVSQLLPSFTYKTLKAQTDLVIPGSYKGWTLGDITESLSIQYQEMPSELIKRWARTYGLMTHTLLGSARTLSDLGEHLIPGLYAKEVEYLM